MKEQKEETKEERKERLFKEATAGSDRKMDEQIREATIRSVIKTISNLSKAEIVVYDETMKSDWELMKRTMHDHIQKLESEFRAEQEVIRQLLEAITDSQVSIARLCNKILKAKTKPIIKKKK